METVLARIDHTLSVRRCVGVALCTRVDLCIEVQAREQRPSRSLVSTTVDISLRCLEVGLNSLQFRLHVGEELLTANLTRIDLTRGGGLVDEGRITKEIHQHPVLISSQEASLSTVGAHGSIRSLVFGILEELRSKLDLVNRAVVEAS